MEVSFKPAPLRHAQTWTLSGNSLLTPKGTKIDLTSVTGGYFLDLPVNRYWSAELQLVSATETVIIRCNDTRSGGNRQNYFLLIFELLDCLKLHNPTLTLRRGTSRLLNSVFACIAIIPIAFGFNFIANAVKNGSDAFGMGLGIFFLLMAVFIVWCASPWERAPMSTPSELKDWLRNYLSGQGLTS